MAFLRAAGAPDFSPPPLVEHVLHIADAQVFTRFGPMLVQLLQALNSAGVRCTLLTDDRAVRDRLASAHIEALLYGRLRWWRWWGVGRFLDEALETAPAIVHCWGARDLEPVQRWAAQLDIPVIVHLLGSADNVCLRGRATKRGTFLALAPRLAPVELGHCTIVPPAIAPVVRRAEPEPAAGTLLPSALYVGPLGWHDDLRPLVDAVAQLAQRGLDLHVFLLGQGPADHACWDHIRSRNMHERFTLVGDERLWEKVLPHADICVVPCGIAELSLAPLLAMALGKVVIAARDQLGDWFVEDQTAWQFTPGSAVELAYLLARAIQQPQHADQLRCSAAAYVRTHHAIEELVAELVGVYTSVISGAGAVAATEEPEHEDRRDAS